MRYGIGIDIGSTNAKTVVMNSDGTVLERMSQPTGFSSVETANAIQQTLSGKNYLSSDDYAVVATGYGRVSVPFADKCVTEISCHAKGACHIFGEQHLGIIDIGGQDTKLIAVTNGNVGNFVMNDKCSAGTGRFLEVMAGTLEVTPGELCELAKQGGNTKISSLCTVFAESEVISLIGRGEARENIAYGVVDSIVQKVKSQAGKLQFGKAPVVLTGGLCDFPYVSQSLSKAFATDVRTDPDARYAGAIGAALFALSMRKQSM